MEHAFILLLFSAHLSAILYFLHLRLVGSNPNERKTHNVPKSSIIRIILILDFDPHLSPWVISKLFMTHRK